MLVFKVGRNTFLHLCHFLFGKLLLQNVSIFLSVFFSAKTDKGFANFQVARH